jgi:hypothetical protein
LEDHPRFRNAHRFTDEEYEQLFIPDIWGPLPYLRRKRANLRARRELRRTRRAERRRAANR